MYAHDVQVPFGEGGSLVVSRDYLVYGHEITLNVHSGSVVSSTYRLASARNPFRLCRSDRTPFDEADRPFLVT